MYTQVDFDQAKAQVKKYMIILFAGIAVFLAVYIAAIIMGSEIMMLIDAILMLLYIMPVLGMWLIPAVRYKGFLREIETGLSRETLCAIEGVDGEIQQQDGARVKDVHVRLAKDDDTRIFYVNVSKAELLPPVGTAVKLESSGRHIVNCSIMEEEAVSC